MKTTTGCIPCQASFLSVTIINCAGTGRASLFNMTAAHYPLKGRGACHRTHTACKIIHHSNHKVSYVDHSRQAIQKVSIDRRRH